MELFVSRRFVRCDRFLAECTIDWPTLCSRQDKRRNCDAASLHRRYGMHGSIMGRLNSPHVYNILYFPYQVLSCTAKLLHPLPQTTLLVLRWQGLSAQVCVKCLFRWSMICSCKVWWR